MVSLFIMKPSVLLALALSVAPFPLSADVQIGGTAEEVRVRLGAPTGQVRHGGRQVLYYAHGSVELRDGRVTRADLRSPEEQAAVEAREARQQADFEARRARLIGEGTALRDRKLADAAFLAAPASYQVSFWEDFARRYPGVSCAEPLAIARVKLNEQLEEKRRHQEERERLVRIEERLAAAESEPHVQTRIVYRGWRDRYQEFALWPVRYTFYDAPLPVYTSPTASPVSSFQGDLAQPGRRGGCLPTGADHRRPGRPGSHRERM